jgi:hypothetical protein
VVDRQAAEGTWSYGMLYDERGMTTVPTEAEMRSLAEHAANLVAVHGERGPVAVVTHRMATHAMVRLYSTLSGLRGVRVEVFRNVGDADRWLSASRSRS